MNRHRFHLIGELDNDRVKETLAWLHEADANDPHCDIEFVITSPGGDMNASSAIFSELEAMSIRGEGSHHVHTKVRGIAGSGASLILQAGDLRTAGVFDCIHMHRPIFSCTDMTLRDVELEMDFCHEWADLFTDVVLERCVLDRAEFEHRLNSEWTVRGEEAYSLGLIDAVC